MLTLVFAEVEDFKSAIIPASGFKLALYTNQALTGGMDGEFAKVGGNPFATQLFGNSGGGAGTAKEVGDKVAFVGGGFDDAFY